MSIVTDEGGKASCETCIWWEQGGAQIAGAARNGFPNNSLGTCHLNPPETVKVVGQWIEAVFPVVHASRFCSCWKEGDASGGGGGERIPFAPIATDTVVAFERRSA
ncbi:hypothetical protein [Sphingomonas sp. UYP23]